MQISEMSQMLAAGRHVTDGAMFTESGMQVPVVPPVFAAKHDEQLVLMALYPPPQAVSQQTPSTQWSFKHVAALAHALPLGSPDWIANTCAAPAHAAPVGLVRPDSPTSARLPSALSATAKPIDLPRAGP